MQEIAGSTTGISILIVGLPLSGTAAQTAWEDGTLFVAMPGLCTEHFKLVGELKCA